MSHRYTKRDIPTLNGKNVFLDANILIYLYWSPSSQYASTYSSYLGLLLKNNVNLFVNQMVISEFINRALRLSYDEYNAKNPAKTYNNYKAYRNSPDGILVQNSVFNIAKGSILSKYTVIDQPLSNKEISNLMQTNSLDFNDKIIEKLCMDRGFILLTNDGDFSSSKVDTLSSHPKLH